MSQRTFSDQEIVQYLLGSSTDAERLDELSFTDDEFAARLQSVENDLVDAYVRGELAGEALENFNLHYLSSPHRRNKVLMARGLKDVLISPEGLDSSTLTESRRPLWNSLREFFLIPTPGLTDRTGCRSSADSCGCHLAVCQQLATAPTIKSIAHRTCEPAKARAGIA